MRRLVLSGIFLFAFFHDSPGDPVDGLEYQSESVATTEFPTSGMINPAGLSFFSASGVNYTHSFTDSTYGGDDALLISSRRGFFGLEWLKHSTNLFRRKYTISIGDRVAPNFYIGLSYSWFGGSIDLYKKMKSWRIGFLYRPRHFVSLGLVADRLNQPHFGSATVKRQYVPGIAIRPFGDKYTLSSDLRWTEGDNIEKLRGSFRFAVGPFKGIRFSADYRLEGSWRIGMSFDFEQVRIGAQGRLNTSQKYDGGSYFVELGAIRYSSVVGAPKRTGTLNLEGSVPEEPEPKSLFGSRGQSFLELISALNMGAADDRIGTLLIRIDGIRMSFAGAQEIREAIGDYRKKGKKVVIYIENGGNLAYYLASAADRIIMNPSGYLMLNGLSASATFYKGTMEKLGIRAQVVRTGPHKTAGDAFTENDLTAAAEEQINWLLDDLYDQMVEGISAGRRILSDDVKRLIDNGPYTSREALEAGLIDELRYYDELTENDDRDSLSRSSDLVEFYEKDDYNPRWSAEKRIAIVYADGAIVAGSGGTGLIQGKLVGGEMLAENLARVRKDRGIRAVVLRVNSPGGDLFASDHIYRELELLKGKKPLVVSMGGVAASGGYYISSPGDEILASPGTITGSIGVIFGKPDFSGFYEKIGVRKRTLRRGDHADINSPDRPATDEEIDLAKRQIWEYYGDFVSKVSTWRKMDYDSVDAIGQGRVWTGRQARARGLIDSYGGIWKAIDQACQKGEIESEDKLILETYPRRRFTFFRWPGISLIGSPLESLVRETFNTGLQFRMPFDLEIE